MAYVDSVSTPPFDLLAGNSETAESAGRAEPAGFDARPSERPEMARALTATLFVNVIAVLAILTAGLATLSAIA